MVRISDARMSGTGFGTVVHVAPEAAVGGPLALVRTGDRIELDVPARALTLEVGEEELARRRAAWRPPETRSGAATPGCTSSTCCRPARARTWTSSSARAGRRCRAITTEAPSRRLAADPPGDHGLAERPGQFC